MFTCQFLNDKIHNYVFFLTFTHEISQLRSSNVCSAEKYTKHTSVLLLRLVYFSLEQTLHVKKHTSLKKYTNWAKLINPAYTYKFQLKTTIMITYKLRLEIIRTQESNHIKFKYPFLDFVFQLFPKVKLHQMIKNYMLWVECSFFYWATNTLQHQGNK